MTKLEIEQINNEFGLTCENGVITTTSLKVAEIYGKQHKHIMEKIRSFIDLIPEINGSNFQLVNYVDFKGEKRPMYEMDRQGFSMLVNKFTGDEATIFTYKYTQAFERLVELVNILTEENEELYKIAISDECQLQRQYDADKITQLNETFDYLRLRHNGSQKDFKIWIDCSHLVDRDILEHLKMFMMSIRLIHNINIL